VQLGKAVARQKWSSAVPQNNSGITKIATMFTTLIMGLIAGPLVSL
jgi:hypothetical protein